MTIPAAIIADIPTVASVMVALAPHEGMTSKGFAVLIPLSKFITI